MPRAMPVEDDTMTNGENEDVTCISAPRLWEEVPAGSWLTQVVAKRKGDREMVRLMLREPDREEVGHDVGR